MKIEKKNCVGGQRQDNCLRLVTITKFIPENSRHSLNQSDAKLKPTTTWSPAFSRALGRVVVFTLSSHWLLKVFSSLLIGCCNYFSFRFTSVNRTTLHNAKERDTHAILVYFRKLFQNYFSSMRTL